MFESLDESSSKRMPPADVHSQLHIGRRGFAALAIVLGLFLRDRTHEQRDWIGLGVLMVGVIGLCVLEYLAYRDRKAGPPSLKG
jgi:hypothetical protein